MILNIHKCRRVTAFLLVLALLLTAAYSGLHWAKLHFFPRGYSQYVDRYCAMYGIDENLAYAVIHTESGFDSDAQSHLGACGLMQLMPDTFDWLQSKQGGGEDEDIFDPETNIRYGVYYLSLLMEKFDDERLAVAAYHAGMGRVSQWLSDQALSPDGKTLQSIPFSDTEYYVRKVELAKRVYDTLYH